MPAPFPFAVIMRMCLPAVGRPRAIALTFSQVPVVAAVVQTAPPIVAKHWPPPFCGARMDEGKSSGRKKDPCFGMRETLPVPTALAASCAPFSFPFTFQHHRSFSF